MKEGALTGVASEETVVPESILIDDDASNIEDM